jgi:hypothetical protein
MSEFFFFIRIMFFTLVAVLLMQVKWGGTTIENHTMDFLTSSAVVAPIDRVAQSAVVFIRNSWNATIKSFNTRFSESLRGENQPGSRLSGLNVDRSEAVSEARRRAEQMRDSINMNASESEDAFEKLKRKAREAGSKIRSSFIDETRVPQDPSRASATPADDESVSESY